MILTDHWFDALAENDEGQMITVHGRDGIDNFIESGKYPERVEISWKYEPDKSGMPSEDVARSMERFELALRPAMEKKDKLAILTGVYTGGGEKTWVFYTRTVRVFGERINTALQDMELFPISIYTEKDPEWAEYHEMRTAKNSEI